MAGNNVAVQVSSYSDADIERLKKFLHGLIEKSPDLAESRLLVRVSGYKNVDAYVRAAPGAKKLVDVLGKESFRLFGALLSVGFQAYDDFGRNDLTGAQKLGRTSLALLGGAVPPLGLVMLGASVVFPEQYDHITAAAFTDQNPVVQWFGGVILKVGGKGMQFWNASPRFIELF